MKPRAIEVKESHLWKSKDLSKIEDLKTLDKKFDWSFSTPFKGKVYSLSNALEADSTFNSEI